MAVKLIGLTGGMGSGKTYVAKIFRHIGISVYDSDANAKFLMENDNELKQRIIKLIGTKAFTSSGKLNRSHIAKVIFDDKKKLDKMNQLVHPVVRSDFKKKAKKEKSAAYFINEAALFVENGAYKDFHQLITVVAPLPLRLERLQQRDNATREEIMARITKQSSDEEKIKVSDFVIYNDEVSNLLVQISEIHRKIMN